MKAKRGDLVIIEHTSRSFVIGQGSNSTTEYRVGVVTNVTREGMVKRYRRAGWGSDDHTEELSRVIGLGRWWVQPADSIDVEACISAAQNHTYPNSTTTRDFPSFDAVREAMRPFKREPVSV